MLSPFGPAEQLHGGSREISAAGEGGGTGALRPVAPLPDDQRQPRHARLHCRRATEPRACELLLNPLGRTRKPLRHVHSFHKRLSPVQMWAPRQIFSTKWMDFTTKIKCARGLTACAQAMSVEFRVGGESCPQHAQDNGGQPWPKADRLLRVDPCHVQMY